MDPTVLIVVVGSAVAGFVQGLSGFAFGLIAMGIWAWSLDPLLAGPLVVFGSLAGQLPRQRRLVADVESVAGLAVRDWVESLACTSGRPVVALHQPARVQGERRPFAGHVVPVDAVRARSAADQRGGQWADAAVGWVGGIMGGLGGLTGPAPILWATLRGWDRHTQRGVFQVFNICMHSLTLATYFVSGTMPRQVYPLFVVMVPALLIPTIAGFLLYRRFSDVTFRRVVLGLLTASGAVLIVTSLLKSL